MREALSRRSGRPVDAESRIWSTAVGQGEQRTCPAQAHVLGRLGLAGAGGAGGRAAEAHAERLREGDVAAVGERRDDEALLDAEVLVAVVELDVGDGDLGDLLVVAPVEARLLRPLEVVRVLDLLLDDLVEDVALVHVDGDLVLVRPLAVPHQLVRLEVHRDEVVEPLLALRRRARLLRLAAVEGVRQVDRHLIWMPMSATCVYWYVNSSSAIACSRRPRRTTPHRLLHVQQQLASQSSMLPTISTAARFHLPPLSSKSVVILRRSQGRIRSARRPRRRSADARMAARSHRDFKQVRVATK